MRHRQVYDATSAEFASFAEECASVARALGIFAIARAKFTREYGAFAEECAAFAEEYGAFTKACALFTWNAERSPKRAERTPACADHLLLRKIHIGGNAVNVRTALFDVCKVVVHAYRIRVLSVEVLSCCSGRRQCFRQIYRAISKGVVLIGFSIRLCSFEVHPER